MIKNVSTRRRVKVEMGEKGDMPRLKVKTILLANAKGAYISPSLLDVL